MGTKITVWCMGFMLLLFVFPVHNTDAFAEPERPMNARIRLRSAGDATPDENRYYLFKVDTLGKPDTDAEGYFTADTTVRNDSLKVVPVFEGDLALWKFEADSVSSDNDTIWYRISNKGAGSRLAFDIPETDDTIASVQSDGALNRWPIPLALLDNGPGKWMTTDTAGERDFFLGMRDDSVMLISDTVNYRYLSFVCEEYVPFDTTQVYRVKYLNGDGAGKFLGANVFGTDTVLLDSVYAHIPDGQFTVCRENTWMLRNRNGGVTPAAGGYADVGDSLQTVSTGGSLQPHQFTNGTDTFEIVAIAAGSIDPADPKTGYRYFMPNELTDRVYTVGYHSSDTLDGLVMGYRPADSIAVLTGDTSFFLMVPLATVTGGPSIANIAVTERTPYRLRSYSRPQLYLSIRDDSLVMDEAAKAASFFLKEDTVRGLFAFVDADAALARKMFVNDNRRLYTAPLDSDRTHLFAFTTRNYSAALPKVQIVDSTRIYTVKYLNGPGAGRFLGADMFGRMQLMDKVYAHLPDGQFVVGRENKFRLDSRISDVKTGRYDSVNDYYDRFDSLRVVLRDGLPVDNQFTNTVDTFEIVAIDYGNIETHQYNPRLGYRYFTQQELTEQAFAFSYRSEDSLNRAYIDYKDADLPCILTTDGFDTARFVVEQSDIFFNQGAQAIGLIPKLSRMAYRFRSVKDSTLYIRMRTIDSVIIMDETNIYLTNLPNLYFFLKDDTIPDTGNYSFIIHTEYTDGQAKMFAGSNRQLYMGPLDSVHTHVFGMEEKDRQYIEPDPYAYMQSLTQGAGLYEISTSEMDGSESSLTRNFYGNAVFRKEGESILRAGSYTPPDFHLWIDQARPGTAGNPDKTSYYIVNDVDTLKSKLNVAGFFLHVMDSVRTAILNPDHYVTVDGKIYNRVNFVQATRASANELLLDTSTAATVRDSVGFEGKNEKAINEFRFYLQRAPQTGKYYIVTEQGYGGKAGIRGYLSSNRDGILYFGPRDGAVLSVSLSTANTVANETKPLLPSIQAEEEDISIVGGHGVIHVRNGRGQYITVYNVVGQQIVNAIPDSDNVSVPVPRGIAIVRIENGQTKKIVVN